VKKTIQTMSELESIIQSVILIPRYSGMLGGISEAKKRKLLEICKENNITDAVDFVIMCES